MRGFGMTSSRASAWLVRQLLSPCVRDTDRAHLRLFNKPPLPLRMLHLKHAMMGCKLAQHQIAGMHACVCIHSHAHTRIQPLSPSLSLSHTHTPAEHATMGLLHAQHEHGPSLKLTKATAASGGFLKVSARPLFDHKIASLRRGPAAGRPACLRVLFKPFEA